MNIIFRTKLNEPLNHQKNKVSIYLSQKKQDLQYLDFFSLILTLILAVTGLIVVYSATTTIDEQSTYFFVRQGIAFGMGLLAMVIIYLLPYQWFEHQRVNVLLPLLMIGVLFLMRIIGTLGGGAVSWIDFGFVSFQPSEFAKIVIILLISWFNATNSTEQILALNQQAENLWDCIWTIILDNLALVSTLIIVTLILLEPDTGTSLLIGLTAYLLVGVYQLNARKMIIGVGTLLTLMIGFSYSIGHLLGDKIAEYDIHQFKRVAVFIDPFKYSDTLGYQLIQGFGTFARGGVIGVGLGNSLAAKGSLPEAHTDFIIAVIAEEFGYLGVMMILFLLVLLILRLIYIAQETGSIYRASVMTGVSLLLFLQISVNLFGVTALLPLTGVPIPFFSYGGSSLLSTMIMIGIVQLFIVEERKKIARKETTRGEY